MQYIMPCVIYHVFGKSRTKNSNIDQSECTIQTTKTSVQAESVGKSTKRASTFKIGVKVGFLISALHERWKVMLL